MRSECGQATIEWTGLVLVVSLALGALASAGLSLDGRSFGGFITHAMVCAVRGGCDDGDDELAAAYGQRDAELVRAYAPNVVYEPGERSLPVDFRDCRSRRCSDAPDDRGLDAHRSDAGVRATAFTHVVRRGDETYIQYWLYYPDSNTTLAGSDRLWSLSPPAHLVTRLATGKPGYPGFHDDDWESYQVRIDRAGRAHVRASSHGHYQGCKQRRCRDRWTPWTGWTRVSHGSHAGHIPLDSDPVAARVRLGRRPLRIRYRYRPLYPGRDLRERTSTAAGLRLVPIGRRLAGSYEPLDPEIKPPWRKPVYRDPRSDSS